MHINISYAYAAASRMRNTYIDAGDFSLDDLFASVDKGIYCKKMGGGSVLPTGQFNFAVDEAYLIENGKITKPLKGATLIGDAKEIMQRNLDEFSRSRACRRFLRFCQWQCLCHSWTASY